MNDKNKKLNKKSLTFLSYGGEGRNSESQIAYGQLTTQENEKAENKQLFDNLLIFKTEESEGDIIINTQPSQIISKLDKLNKKQNIIEEELNHNSDGQIDSDIIKIDLNYTYPQKPQAKQTQKFENTLGQKELDNQEQEQQSYNPQSDNYEFHSNLESLERIEEEQRQKKSSTLKNNKGQRMSIDITSIDKKNQGIKGIGQSQGKIQDQSQQLKQIPNKSQTVIDSSPDKLLKLDIQGQRVIRQIRTAVEDNQSKINLTNIENSNLKQGEEGSYQDPEQLQKIASLRRGGSSIDRPMTRSQKRKTYLSSTSKIKNLFSRTFTEEGPNVLGQLLNSWKFVASLKRATSLWRQNSLTPKQISLIDDSTHFEMDNQGNRRRKKIFGTTLQKESYLKQGNLGRKKNQQESQLFKWLVESLSFIEIIDPQSQYLYVWDTIHSVFITLNLLIHPIEFVTFTHMEEQYSSYFWQIFPIMCFIIFFLDILLNFNTGFYKRGFCIKDRKKVMTNYFRKGFVWDALALLPIIDSLSQFKSGWRAVNIFVICKYQTLRSILGKYLELFSLQNDLFIPTFLKLLKVGFLVLFQAHLFACLFLGLAHLEKSYDLTEVTWIEHYSKQQQSNEEHKLTDQTVFTQYIYAFYWSVTTMTTTGYGDISASNNYEATFTAFSMIIAGGVFAYSFNQIGFIVKDLNKVNQEFQQDMSLIGKYMKNNHIKRNLQIEVTKYIEYKHKAEAELSTKEEKEVLEKLGPHIRDKITISAFFQTIKSIPFLNNNFSRKFLRRLALHMKKVTYLNNDIIFEENDQHTAYHPNLLAQFNIQQQQNQQNNYNAQQYLQQVNAQQNYQLLQLIQQQQQQQLLYQNMYSNPTLQNCAASQSLQFPQMPNQQQQQAFQNYNQINHAQYPQVNSLQSLPTNFAQISANHTRKLSGSLQAPILTKQYSNHLHVNNPNMLNINNLNNVIQPTQRLSVAQIPVPQTTLFQNLNVGSNPDPCTNVHQYIGFTPGNVYGHNQINNNLHDDYQYGQTQQQSQSDISFYIVERGTVLIYSKCYKYINEDEETKPIRELKKGDLLGEISFFNENPRCASAKSIGPSSVLSIKKKDFIKVLKEFPSDYEIFCQIQDEVTINKNLDALYIRCFSCEKYGHTVLDCNKVHFQPDKEKVILKYNYKNHEQVSRNKEIWRRTQKYKCLINYNEINTAQKKVENLLQNQSQISSSPNQNHQPQQNFTTFNHSSNTMSIPSSFNPASNPNQIIRSNKKLLTLKQLQTLQTQADQDIILQPSPIILPATNNYAFNFQPLNNYLTQPFNQLQQNQFLLNTQIGQRQSFQDIMQLESETGPLKSPKQMNFFSSFQSRQRGSNQKEQIIFEEDNETPLEYDNGYFKKNQKLKSPTTVDTNTPVQNTDPQLNKNIKHNLHIKIENQESSSKNNNINSNQNLIHNQNIFGRRLSNYQFTSKNTKESLQHIEVLKKLRNLDRPPQKTRILRTDFAAALGDTDMSLSSSNDEDDRENVSDGKINQLKKKQLKNAKTTDFNHQKSLTNEPSPKEKLMLKKINQIYQDYGITPRNNNQLQKNILLQLQNVFFQNLENQEVVTQDLEDVNLGNFTNEELRLHHSRKATTFINQQKMMAAKREIIFEFPSLNTDRMKNFESYFTNYNCNAVLERLSLYWPTAYNKRNRLYHIYCRDTVKKGFLTHPSYKQSTPIYKRKQGQISKIANYIINSHVKDPKKNSEANHRSSKQQINKKLSIIESQVTKNNTLAQINMPSQSNQYKIRSATVFQEESDDEF